MCRCYLTISYADIIQPVLSKHRQAFQVTETKHSSLLGKLTTFFTVNLKHEFEMEEVFQSQ